MGERVGHSIHWGPVSTHHVRDRRVIRPFLATRTWLMVTTTMLVLTVLLGIVVGSGAGVPMFFGFLLATLLLSRSPYRWRQWREAVAGHEAATQRAAEDERDRELYRQWLRNQQGTGHS